MIKFLKEKSLIIIVVFLFLFPLLFLSSGNEQRNDTWYNQVVYVITSPVVKSVTFVIKKISHFYDYYINIMDVESRNKRLQQNVDMLINQVHQLNEIRLENQRLRVLLNFKQRVYPTLPPPAQIISRDISNEFEIFTINLGTNDHIVENMPVVTPIGVVGRVVHTTAATSTVLTLIDPSSRIDAIIQENRTRGIVVGSAGGRALMKYVSRTDEVNIGDTVIVSGLGGVFPKGLMIGTVKKVLKKPFGIMQHIEIEPSVDFSKLEEVFVIRDITPLTETPEIENK